MSHKRNDSIETPKDEMRTPPSLFNKLDARFHFDGDVAATDENHLCELYYTKEENALDKPWFNNTWCNPPYSQILKEAFIEKAYRESEKGVVTAMLLPVDFSTVAWDTCMLAAEWIRIKGRIRFNGIDNKPIPGSPLFSSVVVIFDADARRKNNDKILVSQMGWR